MHPGQDERPFVVRFLGEVVRSKGSQLLDGPKRAGPEQGQIMARAGHDLALTLLISWALCSRNKGHWVWLLMGGKAGS